MQVYERFDVLVQRYKNSKKVEDFRSQEYEMYYANHTKD